MDVTLEGGTLWPEGGGRPNIAPPVGALIIINGSPLRVAKIEEDKEHGFKVILERTDDLEAEPFLGTFVFPASKP